MKPRVLRQTTLNHKSLLQHNPHFQQAQAHTLKIYGSNSIYTFIPKNACSTMRLSVAMHNGVIERTQDFNWIHENNRTFIGSLNDLVMAEYTFVILRCPYRRLVSTYLDKIVDRTPDAWHLHRMLNRSIALEDMSFLTFVKTLQDPIIKQANVHWKQQHNFLIYKNYDDYFCLEKFNEAIPILKEKAKLTVVDARQLTKHGSDNYTTLTDMEVQATKEPLHFLTLKSKGLYPNYKSMFNEEIIQIIKNEFADDLQLYMSKFGSQNLLF